MLDQDLEAITALLPRLTGAFQRQLAHGLASYGLTFPQFLTLASLERFDGECRMGPLANAAMQSAASMTGIVDRLLEHGLVERERHPEDRRSVVVRLTDRGRELLAEVRENGQSQGRLLLAALSAEERRRLHQLLARIVELVEEPGGGAG